MSNEDKIVENTGLKRVLYLGIENQNSILFDLDNNTTCEIVLNQHKDSITQIINSIHKKNIDECEFLIAENRINKKIDDMPTLMKFKINKKTKLFNLLNNHQNNLLFLPKKKISREIRLKARNENLINEHIYDLAETNYFSNKNIEEYLTKALIYLYDPDKCIFNKEKGSVDKQKITIYKSNTNKELLEINIKDIIKSLYYSDTSQVPYKKKLPIKGDKPKFYIELVTNKITYFLGQFKENLYFQWEKAIQKTSTEYNNYNIELNLNIKINSSKASLYSVYYSIMDSCFIIKKILFSEEKRNMLLSNFSEKKISSIIINVLTYKDLIKKDEYLEAWMRFKEILTYIESYDIHNKTKNPINIEDKIYKIFSKEKIDNYRKISDLSNDNVKKINMVNASLSLFKEEMIKALNNILKEDLFDEIFISLYKLYIIPFYEKTKETLETKTNPFHKPLIRQKFQFLLAIYFKKIFNTSADNFNNLFSNISSQNGIGKNEILSNEIIS